jgi:alkylation response protein AidB-like acyl-CoA dehydrogenase
VTVRPLRQISGEANFNEVFFDDVELTEEASVGPVDGGWGVAVTTLMFERMMVLESLDQFSFEPERLVEPILDHPALADTDFRRRLAGVAVEWIALRYTAYRALTALERGNIPGPEAGLGKIGLVEAGRTAVELLADVLGPDALDGEWGALAAEITSLRIAGGTDEILRNTIGERVLGLPPEPRVDKGKPFSELSRSTNGAPAAAEVTEA